MDLTADRGLVLKIPLLVPIYGAMSNFKFKLYPIKKLKLCNLFKH